MGVNTTYSEIPNNSITISKLDPGVLKIATLTLTAAQIVALDAARTVTYDFVAAPGAGKVIVPVTPTIAYYAADGIAFTGVGANDNIEVAYHNAGTPVAIQRLTSVGVLDATTVRTRGVPLTTVATSQFSIAVNSKLQIQLLQELHYKGMYLKLLYLSL